jgi:RND family efflux transporter MFP subunit
MNRKLHTVALLALAMLSACSGNSDKQSAEAQQETKFPVKLATVSAREVEQIEEYTATVDPEAQNNIAPTSPGRIDRIFVEVGDRVSKGQKLVQMDAASLKQLRLQMENEEKEFNRIDELYKVGGASKSEWDAQKTQLDVRRTSYNNLLENTQLVSPINGVVSARNFDNGDLYAGGTPVLVVEQIQPVKLLINVSEPYFPRIKKGEKVRIALDTYPGETFEGRINLVYPTIDATSHTFPVEIRVANADSRVRPGMFGRVTLSFGMQNHIVVPDEAIVKRAGSGDRYVYVYHPDKGTVSYNKVELGRRLDTEYELLSGVDDQSQVVIAGQSKLANGVAVEVQQ